MIKRTQVHTAVKTTNEWKLWWFSVMYLNVYFYS